MRMAFDPVRPRPPTLAVVGEQVFQLREGYREQHLSPLSATRQVGDKHLTVASPTPRSAESHLHNTPAQAEQFAVNHLVSANYLGTRTVDGVFITISIGPLYHISPKRNLLQVSGPESHPCTKP